MIIAQIILKVLPATDKMRSPNESIIFILYKMRWRVNESGERGPNGNPERLSISNRNRCWLSKKIWMLRISSVSNKQKSGVL